MPKNTTKIGNLGETVACQYLLQLGYSILERNYSKKWGEIDIILQKDAHILFLEVKSVTHETKSLLEWAVSHETWQPEDLVHKFKRRQIKRIVETWLLQERYTGDFKIKVAAVHMVPEENYATIKILDW